MIDNQNTKTELLQQLTETHRHAPTISRFVEEYFSELVPHSDYFAHLVRDDVGGEMLPPLPEEVIARLPRYYPAVTDLYATPTKPEEVLARLPCEFTEPMRCVSVGNLEFPRAPSNDTLLYGRKPM